MTLPKEYRIYEFKKPGIDWRNLVQRLIPTFAILLCVWILFVGLGGVINSLTSKLITIPLFIIALVLHELAHAYMADFLGDPTPRLTGRLTLNPLRHLDIVGTLLFLLCGFGWAKPVEVDSSYFKNPNRAMVSVGLAGPLCNFALAVITCLIIRMIAALQGIYPIYYLNSFFGKILFEFLQINVVLAVFNLIPVPPLDGSKLVYSLIPDKYKSYYYIIQENSFIVFAFLFIFGGQIITPIVRNLIIGLLKAIVL